MRSGHPLSDADRAPWLAAIAAAIDAVQARGAGAVVACSGLKRAYRQRLVGGRHGVRLVFLDGSPELIARRLAARQGHFMPASLLASQFAALEPPSPDENPIVVAADQPVARIVDEIAAALEAPEPPAPAAFTA
jgi:gluconokinase